MKKEKKEEFTVEHFNLEKAQLNSLEKLANKNDANLKPMKTCKVKKNKVKKNCKSYEALDELIKNVKKKVFLAIEDEKMMKK